MASWLVIDWDQDHFHLLCATSTRHGVNVTRAASWPHQQPFTPSTADTLGKALREFLKTARIAPAPVIFGLGRDRIFLKELRFPEIAPHEEANLVRFQTGKELTESVENYAVDYAHLNKDGAGERHVMTVAVRKDVIGMIQTFCQAAGLKLHAITPKLFGMANALDRAIQPEESPLAPKTLNAVLSVGQRWAELCFFRGRRLLQAQALANGPMLVSEIRRNLAVFQAQHAVNLELSGPNCLYMFGEDQGGVQSSDNGHQLPIRILNPLKPEPKVAGEVKTPACFAGAVGLAELWSKSSDGKPINLATPKRSSAPTSVTKQRGIFYGAAAAVFVIALIGMMWYTLAQSRNRIVALNKEKVEQEEFLKGVAQERADLEAYKDWEQTTISWLDELYDLSARYPWQVGFRVNQFSASTSGTKKGLKDQNVAKINLSGYMPAGKDALMKDLNSAMSRDAHVHAQPAKVKPGTGEYQLKIDLAKQDVRKFDLVLMVPPQPPPAPVEKKIEEKKEPEVPDKPDDAKDGKDGDSKDGDEKGGQK